MLPNLLTQPLAYGAPVEVQRTRTKTESRSGEHRSRPALRRALDVFARFVDDTHS